MSQTNFQVTQVYKSGDKQALKASIKAIVDRYLTARLKEIPFALTKPP